MTHNPPASTTGMQQIVRGGIRPSPLADAPPRRDEEGYCARTDSIMPVLLMSTLAATVELPGVAGMSKPFDLEDIVHVIGRLLADRGQ